MSFFSFFMGTKVLLAQALEVHAANQPPLTPENLISDIFLGSGVEILDILFEGDSIAVGAFKNGQAAFGIADGIVMTTGSAAKVASVYDPIYNGEINNSPLVTDVALERLIETNSTLGFKDIVSYEITFRASASRIQFEYVFASNEYPNFACGDYNDVFGFFVSGPNPGGGDYDLENIALVPGTNLPVSVNSVHNGNPTRPDCSPINPDLYNVNLRDNNFLYNAYLDIFTASIELIPCEVYTIRLSLADVADFRYDSGVFLKAKSFSANDVIVSVVTPSISQSISEGCTPASVTFSIPNALSEDLVVKYEFAGTAIPGIDFFISDSSIVIPAGSTSVTMLLTAITDAFDEPIEDIFINITQQECSQSKAVIYIKDARQLDVFDYPDTTMCTGESLSYRILDQTLQFFEFKTKNTFAIPEGSAGIEVPLEVSGIPFNVLNPGVLESICINLSHPRNSDLRIYLQSPSGRYIELSSGNGGADAFLATCFTLDAVAPIGGIPIMNQYDGKFLPEGGWSKIWGNGVDVINGIWKLYIYDDQPGGTGTLMDWTLRIPNPEVNTYSWFSTDTFECIGCRDVVITPERNDTYYVTKSNELGCSITDSFEISVINGEYIEDLQCAIYPDSVVFLWYTGNPGDTYLVRIDDGNWVKPNYTERGFVVAGLSEGDTVNFSLAIDNQCYLDTFRKTVITKSCALLAYNAIPKNPSCYGLNDGAVQINDVNQYDYWLLGSKSNIGVFENLRATEYAVIISDQNGCSSHFRFTLTEPQPIEISSQILKDVLCFGQSDGAVDLTINNTQGEYQILWDDNSTLQNRTDLDGGMHILFLADENGCTGEHEVILNNPSPIGISLESTPLVCGIPNTASVNSSINGGQGPFSYRWSNGRTTGQINSLNDGRYHVTATDQAGCDIIDSIDIESLPPLNLIIDVKQINCPGMNNGIAQGVLSGGTMPYSYQWAHGPTRREVSGLGIGTYGLSIEDANGCVASDSFTLIDGADIFEVAEAEQPGCNGDGKGAIELILNPLYEPYSVLWSSSTIYENNGWGISNLVPGSYGVFIEDGNGCQYNKSFTIDTLNPLKVNSLTEQISCQGNTDGKIFLELESSNGSVEYQLNDGAWQVQPLFLNLGPGNYSVTSIDEAGCMLLLDTLVLEDPPMLTVDLGNDTIVRRGQELILTPIVNIDNPNFVFQWIISQDGPGACDNCVSFTSNPQKSFSVKVIVSDGGTCFAEDFIKVVVNNEFSVLVPTAFTPNSDHLNDRLLVHGTHGVKVKHFQIFDRAYNLLFEDYDFDINDPTRGWDGRNQGKESNESIIIWKVIATLDEEIDQVFSGTSKIIRN